MSRAGAPRPGATPPSGAQLALRFPLSSRASFETFQADGNRELVRRLEALDEAPGEFRGYFLFGAPGVGRTHLLQAACQRHGPGAGAIYLPVGSPGMTPALLEGLDSRRLVALDDVEAWIGQAEAEEALLHLYHGLVAAGGRLLISASRPAARLHFHYADLASRLRGLPAYQVQSLDDAGKGRVLAGLARERGLELSAAVLDFWLVRTARDLPTLLEDFERLDAAAMAEQRRITVPLVKQVLGL